MKRLIITSLMGTLLASAGLAQSNNEWREQWFKMKFGRNTPMEEARQKAEQSSSAYRAEPALKAAPRTEMIVVTHSQQDERFKMKFGRYPR